MEFTAFDTQKIQEYEEQAKKEWGATSEYKEFEQKNADKTMAEIKSMGNQLMSDRKSTRLNSSHLKLSRMPSSA